MNSTTNNKPQMIKQQTTNKTNKPHNSNNINKQTKLIKQRIPGGSRTLRLERLPSHGQVQGEAVLRAKYYTPEIIQVKFHWKMPLKVHWQFPVNIHWKSDNPVEHTAEK